MRTYKWVVSLIIILLIVPMLALPIFAQDDLTFRYELTVNGSNVVEVNTGDIITVTLYLYRTDANAEYFTPTPASNSRI